jgi:L-threonylcarbamoyladenylate synthase
MTTTHVLRIHSEQPDPKVIQQAAEVLKGGGLVAFPTETVYGLGAHALDAVAVRRIFEVKRRPAGDPLIVHVSDAEHISPLVAPLTPTQESWLRKLAPFWPGPLTLVLPRSARVPLEVTAGLPSVAVRVPAHPVARALLEAAGLPVAAPSANLFTRPSPTTAEHVRQDLDGAIELILDGGPTWHGVESTVVDLTGELPTLLRPGAVTVERLQEALPELRVPTAVQGDAHQAPQRSPGTHLRHYSPKARVMVFVGRNALAVQKAIEREVRERLLAGTRVGVLLSEEALVPLAQLRVAAVSLGPAHDLESAASRLFAGLRTLDEQGVDLIITRGFPGYGLGRTLQDRLLRAAEGRLHVVDE